MPIRRARTRLSALGSYSCPLVSIRDNSMRIGFITDANVSRLDWAQANGFRSIGWNRFEISGAGPQAKDWEHFAEEFAAAAAQRGIRISVIGALYKNPLDAEQADYARSVFL